MKIAPVVCSLALLAGCASRAPSPEVKSQLAPTGELRVAVLTSNPIIHRTTPALGRELAALAVFLASEAAASMTASALAMDGGWTQH